MAAPLGDTQAEQRLLQCGRGGSLHFGSEVRLQGRLGARARFLRSLAVNLLGALGNIREHNYLVRGDFEETACDGQMALLAVDSVHELPNVERSDRRLMTV
jgi:hypothetical protein